MHFLRKCYVVWFKVHNWQAEQGSSHDLNQRQPSPVTPEQVLIPWWGHQMETFSALLAICAGNSPVTGEFPAQRPVTRSFDVFFDPDLNKRLSKQSWVWWSETQSCSLWRHCNAMREVVTAIWAKSSPTAWDLTPPQTENGFWAPYQYKGRISQVWGLRC